MISVVLTEAKGISCPSPFPLVSYTLPTPMTLAVISLARKATKTHL